MQSNSRFFIKDSKHNGFIELEFYDIEPRRKDRAAAWTPVLTQRLRDGAPCCSLMSGACVSSGSLLAFENCPCRPLKSVSGLIDQVCPG